MNRDHAGGGSEDQGRLQPVVDLRTTRAVGIATRPRPHSPDLWTPIRAAADLWHSGLGLRLSIELPATAVGAETTTLERQIDTALEGTGLPPRALQVGFTEDALTDAEAVALIERLRDRGVTIAVTGFGTAAVSIRDLVRLPIDSLWLDPTLTGDLSVSEGAAIVRASVHLAHQLGMRVAAEGVEEQNTWRRLRSMGVDRAEGPLVSPPLSAREIPAWLAAWNQRARELAPTRRFRSEQSVPA